MQAALATLPFHLPRIMPDTYSRNQRTQLFLLLDRLLSPDQGASPFTLLIDSLEQSSKPLLREYVRRAKVGTFTGLLIVRVIGLFSLGSGICVEPFQPSLCFMFQHILALYPRQPSLMTSPLHIVGRKEPCRLRLLSDPLSAARRHASCARPQASLP